MVDVVVTGGAGFIGSHLVEELLNLGHKVIVVDNLHTGNLANIQELEGDITIIQGDVGKFFSSYRGRYNYIFHLGMPSSSPMYRQNPHLVGVVVSEYIKILEYVRKYGGKIILASTSSLYKGNRTPFNEQMKIYPTDLYTEARYALERLSNVYSQLYDVPTTVLRLFSVFGEREEYKGRYANIITQMIWCGLERKPFIIYGDGTQERDFIYVKDVVQAFIRAMEYDKPFAVFNVCRGESRTLNQIRNMITAVTGIEIDVIYKPNPIKNYIYAHRGSTYNMHMHLGVAPRYNLEDAIMQTYLYYRRLKEEGFVFDM